MTKLISNTVTVGREVLNILNSLETSFKRCLF